MIHAPSGYAIHDRSDTQDELKHGPRLSPMADGSCQYASQQMCTVSRDSGCGCDEEHTIARELRRQLTVDVSTGACWRTHRSRLMTS